jgi:Tol biopolymer transport system component
MGRLLFSRFIEQTHTFTGMYLLGPDGESTVPLPGPEGGGRWSTAGTEIAVMTILPDERVGTAIIEPDGTVLRVLEIPDPTLNAACTIWTADDARLACESWDDTDPSRGGIYSVRASDGGDLQRLTEPPGDLRDIPGDYSADGSLVLKRYSGDEGPGPLMILDPAGGEPRVLAEGPYEDEGRFSPDGRLVATSAGGAIEIMDLEGAMIYRFGQRVSFGPAWSPDGTRIVYSEATTGFIADLVTARPDGSDQQPATSTPENEITVDWGPAPG